MMENEKPALVQGKQHMVSPITAFVRYWTRWSFRGRASRSEYWWAWLINTILGWVLTITLMTQGSNEAMSAVSLFSLLSLIGIIPGLAIFVRRMHDTNHSGWCILLNILPVIGTIILLIFLLTVSNRGENDYGPMPNVR